MHYVYLLKSINKEEYYLGSTNDLKKRLVEHNAGNVISTKRYSPWRVIYYEAYLTESLARKRESRLKHHGNSMKELKNRNTEEKSGAGFTLIELLVVIAIIALLASIAMIALVSARQKSRDVKRLSDMTQMNTALELYHSYNKGYPSSTLGVPQSLSPTFLSSIPRAPTPEDGVCDNLFHTSDNCTAKDANCAGVPQNSYYYVPSGTAAIINGVTVYPDYEYFFCLGQTTGSFPPGPKILTPKGVR